MPPSFQCLETALLRKLPALSSNILSNFGKYCAIL
uniref:Uncharacterized protein n=1 Tax=Rhizophora mucronata TaxID=61149 RepID=A0A2P2QYV5_RHIMU